MERALDIDEHTHSNATIINEILDAIEKLKEDSVVIRRDNIALEIGGLAKTMSSLESVTNDDLPSMRSKNGSNFQKRANAIMSNQPQLQIGRLSSTKKS